MTSKAPQVHKSPTLILSLAGLLATALVSATHMLTAPAIELQEQKQLLTIFNEVLPARLTNNKILETCRLIKSPLLGNEQSHSIYIGRQDQEPSAIIYNATAPDGYNGEIKLVVAVSMAGIVTGVRVLSHSETPGLGDKIERRKSDWVEHFNAKSLSPDKLSNWAVSKDGGEFDAFTGATITPRAVVKAVKNVLLLHNANKQNLINSAPQCESK